MQGFRALANAELEIPARGLVIVGPNGSGKSSLIEALLYNEVFRSVRSAGDRELVRFGEAGFHVRATVTGSRQPVTVAAGYDARLKQKKVTVDGAVPERLAAAIGIVRGVVLSPGDAVLVTGGPKERRRLLDVLLSLTERGYMDALARYRRALAQRLRAAGGEMASWEKLLGEHGAAVAAARRRWVARWNARYAELCGAMGEGGVAAMEYRSRTESTAEALAAALERSREKDRAQGRTSAGPHRDELVLKLDGRELRSFGSAGQQRTAAMALRIVEAETLESASGVPATMCLDDAFAELDDDRSRRLVSVIEEQVGRGWQVIAAVPKAGDVPAALESLTRWTIREGAIGKTDP